MSFKRIGVIIVVAVMLFGSGYATHSLRGTPQQTTDTSKIIKKYPLLAKRVFIEDPSDPVVSFAQLRQQLTAYFNDNGLKGGMYFEYLPTGTSARIDADIQSVAASLMKLPAAMDAYKASEMGKVDLNKTITLQQSWLDPAFGTLYQKGAGYQMSLRDAVKVMLEQSDNTAHRAVTLSTFNMVPSSDGVLNAVDVDLTQNKDLTVSIGPRSYSSFLKCLYFSCYLNHEDSQEILDYLTKSKFDDRITAGVSDKSVKIAHKIGVYDNVQSDCGIVYVPKRNYLICVMLKGTDASDSDKHIAELSKLTYDYVVHN